MAGFTTWQRIGRSCAIDWRSNGEQGHRMAARIYKPARTAMQAGLACLTR